MNTQWYSILVNVLFAVSFCGLNGDGVGLYNPSLMEEHALSAEDITGTWKIDLRPTPDAAPYYQYLTISKVEEGRVFGSYYNSPIQYGNINQDWGRVVIAFVTQDAGGNTYNTTVELEGDTLRGTTHSIGRDFLAVWTGQRPVKE